MKFKVTRRTALKLAAAAVPAIALGRPALADPIIVKFSHVVSPDAPKGKAACCSSNSPKNTPTAK